MPVAAPASPTQARSTLAPPPAAVIRRYGLALASLALATLIRLWLDPVLGDRQPFVVFYLAVIVTAWFANSVPALFVLVLGASLAEYLFIPPKYTFTISKSQDIVGLLLYLTVGLSIIAFSEALKRARRRAEASAHAFDEHQKWVSTILKSIGDAVIATDANGQITFMNAVAEALTGWPAAAAQGRALEEVFHIVNEQTRERVENPVARVIREGHVIGLATHTLLLAKDGTPIPIDDSGAPIKDDEGKIVGLVLIFRDISERRSVEQALSESEERFRIMADTAPVLVWTAGTDKLYRYVNQVWLEFTGRTMEQETGQGWTAGIHPDDLPRWRSAYVEAFEARQKFTVEYRLRRHDGEYRWLLDTGIPRLSRDGSFVGYIGSCIDITERKQSETELRRREDQLRVVTDAMPAVISYVDAEGRYRFNNHVYTEWFGHTREEILGKHMAEVDGEAAYEAVRGYVAKALAGEEVSFERMLSDEEGGARYVNTHYIPDVGEQGEVKGFFVMINDLTERKRAEAELQESEERYRYLANSMPQIVWTARPDGWFDYYNQRWVEYTGMTIEQTQGWGWQPVLHPDDVEHCLRCWATAVESGESYEIEYRFKRASDGAYRWHLGRAVPMRDGEGQIVKWFGTATDIDDQKRLFEKSRFLAEASGTLAASLDRQTILESVARLAVTYLADWCAIDILDENRIIQRTSVHGQPAQESIVRELNRRYPPTPESSHAAMRVLRSRQPALYPELDDALLSQFAQDDEHLRLLRELNLKSYMCVPLVARGRTLGTLTLCSAEADRRYSSSDLVLAEDLAHRIALAVDNVRLYRRTEESNQAKDEFLATLSHELRTPLTPIIGWVHMMRDGRLQEAEVKHGLQVIDKNSQSLTRLINDLLDMSAILSGKMRIEHGAINLEALLKESIETVRAEAARRNIQLEFSSAPDGAKPPLIISGDRTRLGQVFWNLLNNAIKFSGENGRVRIFCESDEAQARVTVEDEGQGIMADFLPFVFERFRQADGSTTRAHGGLGIGLALVKSLIEAHGGTAAAESAGMGHGSRFTITLPLSSAPDAKSLPPLLATETPITLPPARPSETEGIPRVLIVEDATDTLELLEVVFASQGYQATLCKTAGDALRIAPTLWFDIIVSDIGLPHIDGYELIKRLRQMPHLRDTPAVALTGYAAPKDVELARLAGFDKHIPKPVDPVMLVDVIGQLLRDKSKV